MIFGGIFFLLSWLSTLLLAIWGWACLVGENRGQASPRQSPLEIAKERYARGEISKEELQQLQEDLSQPASCPLVTEQLRTLTEVLRSSDSVIRFD